METRELEIAGVEHEVKYAETVLDHFIGMRGRKEGKMFFRFPLEKSWTLDMAFVLSDLYLYFFDSDREMVEAIEAERWGLLPNSWSFYQPEQPTKYLLESSEPLGITRGERFELR